ncbi:MAG: hypothetical protein ACM3X1_05765 [Ignavibacteriales bacterium]
MSDYSSIGKLEEAFARTSIAAFFQYSVLKVSDRKARNPLTILPFDLTSKQAAVIAFSLE